MSGQIKTIVVVGAGQMGAGIAQVAAASGLGVILKDIDSGVLDRAIQGVQKRLGRAVEKGKIAQDDMLQILKRIRAETAPGAIAEADFVVEAAPENPELKKRIWDEISAQAKPSAIFASNTSSISITQLAAGTDRPERFIGMHFMNPVPVMKLVEVIPGLQTTDACYDVTRSLAESLGKTVVRSDDQPGFIVNRVLLPMINEAVVALGEGLGTPEDIDLGMKLGTNMPMGPLTLADFIGLDTCLSIMEVLHTQLGDSKYRPAPLLRRYVAAGWLGKKSGRGFHEYAR